MKLDYSIQSPEERKALVEQILAETPNPSLRYLEILADYLVISVEKEERRQRKILTENRMVTVNKRECSFEGLVSQLENGEDGIYNMVCDNKNTLFQPKNPISQHDIDTIPDLRQVVDAIHLWEEKFKTATGRDRFIIKNALIDLRKDQYIIRQAYQRPIVPCKLTNTARTPIPLDDTTTIDENGDIHVSGVSLMNHKVVSAILCNYSKLKEDSYESFDGDMWYLIQTFEQTCDAALAEYPMFKRIVELKIDKKQNSEIHTILYNEFGETFTPEYISALWRNKIPKLIAATALEEYISWYYRRNGLPLKKCTKCGQLKPAHQQFFSRNKASKDKFYSICKKCRSTKNKKKE